MPQQFRVCTFNCENLFSRAKLLNFDDNRKAKPLLEAVAELDAELAKTTYDAPRILRLHKAVARYIMVRENRGKLFGSGGTRVVAKGRGDWEGSIEFLRDTVPPEAQKNTARIVRSVDADVVCAVEVEDRRILERFAGGAILKTQKYAHTMLVDGNDPRGIDVGVMSRFPIEVFRSHIDDRDDKGRIFSRDCLEARIKLPNSKNLWLLANHLKSQGYGSKSENDARRKRQAVRVAEILNRTFDLSNDLVVVAGDFNDHPQSAALAPLMRVPNLHNVVGDHLGADSWTYAYRGAKSQIDYLMLSEPLKSAVVNVGVERRGMFGVDKLTDGKIKPLPTVKRQKEAASDHAAVYVDFRLA